MGIGGTRIWSGGGAGPYAGTIGGAELVSVGEGGGSGSSGSGGALGVEVGLVLGAEPVVSGVGGSGALFGQPARAAAAVATAATASQDAPLPTPARSSGAAQNGHAAVLRSKCRPQTRQGESLRSIALSLRSAARNDPAITREYRAIPIHYVRSRGNKEP